MMQTVQQDEWNGRSALENPFAEAVTGNGAMESKANGHGTLGFAPWSESFTPFAEALDSTALETDSQRLLAEAFAELRDESFDEALEFLAEETEAAVSDRFQGETAASPAERERYAEAHLSSLQFEAEQYLTQLEAGLAGLSLDTLSPEQLDEVLDRFDPQPRDVTPAGEEFLGKLIRKAKGVVKFVAKAAGSVGKLAGTLIGPVLNKLRGLIRPLLKRVLSFAIGRLPAPLQAAARTLASKIQFEAEEESYDESPASPAMLTDVEQLAESFDYALAEAVVADPSVRGEDEDYLARQDEESAVDGRELERLAEARGALIDHLRDAGEDENHAPAVENFVPALLGALRLGVNLVGRPKVVGFLANYLSKLIGRWVGPQLSRPLSSAIVDTGLRLVTLEAEDETQAPAEFAETEAAPVALAAVVEDTVRRLAESESYIFESEELTQVATADAFSAAVATHFPPRFVRPALQQAPSLGGTFVARRPRSIRTYRKYSRVPEIEVTQQIADTLPTFGGTTVGAALRAAGVTLPMRARMHIYQAAVGSTLPRMIRLDRSRGGRGYVSAANAHPLTPAAAGLLLREPKLGVRVPAAYLRSRQRIAVGQRFYLFEPLNAANALALPAGAGARAAAARLSPSRSWTVINLRHARITVGMYLSEADAQRIATATRQGQGGLALLKALTDAYQDMDRFASSASGQVRIVREDLDAGEMFAAPEARLMPAAVTTMLRRRMRGWVLPALANWARANAEAFARAVAHPDAGVTIRIRLTAVPGLNLAAQAGALLRSGASPSATARGTPTVTITIVPGRRRH